MSFLTSSEVLHRKDRGKNRQELRSPISHAARAGGQSRTRTEVLRNMLSWQFLLAGRRLRQGKAVRAPGHGMPSIAAFQAKMDRSPTAGGGGTVGKADPVRLIAHRKEPPEISLCLGAPLLSYRIKNPQNSDLVLCPKAKGEKHDVSLP